MNGKLALEEEEDLVMGRGTEGKLNSEYCRAVLTCYGKLQYHST